MFRLFAVITFAACTALNFGCSALHNVGEASDSPGVHVRAPSLFERGEIAVTADTVASLDELSYEGGKLILKNAKFGQKVVDATSAQVAKIEAIGDAQSEIARARGEAIAQGINASAELIESIIPIFQWLQLGKLTPRGNEMELTLPGGFSIGNKRINGSAEAQAALIQLFNQAQQAKSDVSRAQAAASQPVAGGQ